jgi:N-acyl-D-aspartate/D-glutamate deacylase
VVAESDIVLRGGRVIDPESGLDAIGDVAISGGRVTAVTTGGTAPGTGAVPGRGRVEVDVSGQVVTAGFVDIHSHCYDTGSLRLQALDGVTTALELESGVAPVALAYRNAAAEGRPVNYGFATSWAMARMAVLAGIPLEGSVRTFFTHSARPEWQRAATPAEQQRILAHLEADIGDGALGIGVLAGYVPTADPAEYLQVAALASRSNVATYTHSRDLVEFRPQTLIDGAEEIVRAAGETGAHMHYCHVNSTTLRHADRVLGLVERAQREGSRVTTEAYPYGAGMTGIGAAFLAPERLPERDLTPQDLIYAPTGETVADAARLAELRATDPGGLVIIRHLDESAPSDRDLLLRYLLFPGSVVASDAMPLTWSGTVPDTDAWPLPPAAFTHPRTAGTFSRAIRLLTRDGLPRGGGALNLTQALAKCSLEPARLLEPHVPAMRRKGRITAGADADVVVFDPAVISDQSTYTASTRPSTGIGHVLVNGTFVVRDGRLIETTRPGRPVRARQS